MSHYSSRSSKPPRPKRHDRIAKRTMTRKPPCPNPARKPERLGHMRFVSPRPRHKARAARRK